MRQLLKGLALIFGLIGLMLLAVSPILTAEQIPDSAIFFGSMIAFFISGGLSVVAMFLPKPYTKPDIIKRRSPDTAK